MTRVNAHNAIDNRRVGYLPDEFELPLNEVMILICLARGNAFFI
ncbi:MAG: hypothetical protein OD817_08750 [Gammaproteobacteria bacterium]